MRNVSGQASASCRPSGACVSPAVGLGAMLDLAHLSADAQEPIHGKETVLVLGGHLILHTEWREMWGPSRPNRPSCWHAQTCPGGPNWQPPTRGEQS